MEGLLTGAVTNNGGSSSTWIHKSPADILADFNARLEEMWKTPQPLPDRVIVPYSYLYPTPVRFRVTGKRGHKRLHSAIERERRLQARGSAPRRSILHTLEQDRNAKSN